MTDNTVHYYNHLLEVTQQALVRIRKKIYSIGTLRLCWVILTLIRSLFFMGIQYRNYYRYNYCRYSLFFRNDAYP